MANCCVEMLNIIVAKLRDFSLMRNGNANNVTFFFAAIFSDNL